MSPAPPMREGLGSPKLLCWFQQQLVSPVRFYRLRGKEQVDRRTFVPGWPLIHVVGTQKVSASAHHRVQCGLV